jgi:DNA-binding FrmR family transcriptional regulator
MTDHGHRSFARNPLIEEIAQIILKDHLAHCLVDAVESDDLSAIDNLNKAVEQFMK